MKQSANSLEEFFGAPHDAKLSSEKARLRELAQSAEIQKLMGMLKSGGANVEHAANAAIRGDTGEISKLLDQLAGDPEGAEVVEKLRNRFGT